MNRPIFGGKKKEKKKDGANNLLYSGGRKVGTSANPATEEKQEKVISAAFSEMQKRMEAKQKTIAETKAKDNEQMLRTIFSAGQKPAPTAKKDKTTGMMLYEKGGKKVGSLTTNTSDSKGSRGQTIPSDQKNRNLSGESSSSEGRPDNDRSAQEQDMLRAIFAKNLQVGPK